MTSFLHEEQRRHCLSSHWKWKLPYAFDTLRGGEQKSVVLVVSPLISLQLEVSETVAMDGQERGGRGGGRNITS